MSSAQSTTSQPTVAAAISAAAGAASGPPLGLVFEQYKLSRPCALAPKRRNIEARLHWQPLPFSCAHFHAALPLPGRRCAEITDQHRGLSTAFTARVRKQRRRLCRPIPATIRASIYSTLWTTRGTIYWLAAQSQVVLALACSSLFAFRSCVYSWVSSRSSPLSVVRGGSTVHMSLRMHACHGPWSSVSVTEPLTGAEPGFNPTITANVSFLPIGHAHGCTMRGRATGSTLSTHLHRATIGLSNQSVAEVNECWMCVTGTPGYSQ